MGWSTGLSWSGSTWWGGRRVCHGVDRGGVVPGGVVDGSVMEWIVGRG